VLLGKCILVFQEIAIVLKCLSLKLKDSDLLKLCELLGKLSRASAARSNSRCYVELSFLEFSFLSCILGGCHLDWLPGSERERASTLDFSCVGG